MTANAFSSPRFRRALIAALAFAAYLPSLFGGFVYDDDRFVEQNPAVHSLTPANAVRYFTDPRTLAAVGHEGIYRPVRTLDFAIDWAISGGRPWFFHLRNVLYHVLGSLLALAVLRRLLEEDGPALFGALVFALHPVNVESVAWITSRGDVLLVVTFLLALLLHLEGRRVGAALVLLLALFSKESAVVFPAAALLVDAFRKERLRWVWYGIYGGIAAGYVVFWFLFLGGGTVLGVGHLPHFWGGSYGANLLTMAKGFLYYAKLIVLPTQLVIDYHVPPTPRLDAGAAVAIVLLLSLALAALLASRRSRFAALWFFATILPVSNLIRPIGIPTAERFLYLPLLGVALFAGPLLFSRWRLAAVAVGCLFVLTFARSIDWRSDDALWDAADRVAVTPRGLAHRASRELARAHEDREERDRAVLGAKAGHHEAMVGHAKAVCRVADEYVAYYEDVLGLGLGKVGGRVLSDKANALILLGRPAEAAGAADRAVRLGGGAEAYYNAALALERLGRRPEAALNLTKAAELFEERGEKDRALRYYHQSWEMFPDPERNGAALAGVRRLGR
ncbi:MAG: hypothetical protein ACYTDY_02790 [Planctomycetota bacterium]|jgi:tetratricopeptide (TPR) repeat protein